MASNTTLPKYVQVSEMLIRDIAAGLLVDGACLPPEREMAEELGISVGTLRKSLDDLTQKGLLERVQGSGNYVRDRADASSVYALFRLERIKGGGLPTAQALSVKRMRKPEGVPNFGTSAEAHRIRRIRFLDAEPVALEEIWLDGDLCAHIHLRDLSDSLYQFYRQNLGITIGRVEDRIGIDPLPQWAPDAIAHLQGHPVGYVERVSNNAQVNPIEYSRTWFDYHKARYVSRMGRG